MSCPGGGVAAISRRAATRSYMAPAEAPMMSSPASPMRIRFVQRHISKTCALPLGFGARGEFEVAGRHDHVASVENHGHRALGFRGAQPRPAGEAGPIARGLQLSEFLHLDGDALGLLRQ